MLIFIIISLFITIVAVVFAVQNSDTATVQFLSWEGELPLAVVLILTMVAGVFTGLFLSLPSNIRNRLRIRSQNKTISELNTKVEDQRLKLEETETRLKELEDKQEEPVEEITQPEILPVPETDVNSDAA